MFAKSVSSFRPRAQEGEIGNYGETMKKNQRGGGKEHYLDFCGVFCLLKAFPCGPAPHVEHDLQGPLCQHPCSRQHLPPQLLSWILISL